MYITLNNFSPVIISCLVYMLYDDKLYMLKSINKVSVLFCSYHYHSFKEHDKVTMEQHIYIYIYASYCIKYT